MKSIKSSHLRGEKPGNVLYSHLKRWINYSDCFDTSTPPIRTTSIIWPITDPRFDSSSYVFDPFFFKKKILLSVQSRSLSNVEMLLHWAPHALSALAQTAVWKSVSNKFGAGLACDHEPRRSHDCHSALGLPQQPRQICTGFTALTTSAARTNYRTVSGTCRNKALTQKGCLVSAGLYYLFIFLSPS